jgi:hypothetical protein
MKKYLMVDDGGCNDDRDHNHDWHPASLASATQHSECLLNLSGAKPKTQALFTAMRCEMTPERYEAMLSQLTSLASAWLSARYRIDASLADEFAWQWRNDLVHDRLPGLSTIERLGDDLHNRGPSERRDRMTRGHAHGR